MKRTTKRKLLKAKLTLQTTLKKILDINKKRKKLSYFKTPPELYNKIKDELRVLNKVAEQQARLIELYEMELIENRNMLDQPPHDFTR